MREMDDLNFVLRLAWLMLFLETAKPIKVFCHEVIERRMCYDEDCPLRSNLTD